MRIRLTALSMVSIVVAAGVLAAPVAAQAAGTSTIVEEQARGPHCVVALSAGSAATRSVVKDYRCFATLAKAVTFASGGAVRVGPRSSFSTTDTALRHRVSSFGTSPVLGIEYNANGFGGTSLTLTGSGGTGCYGGTEYSFSSLGNYGWNDKIESARTYSNCVGVHYKNTWFSGTSTSVYGSKSDFGTLSNEISSIRFF